MSVKRKRETEMTGCFVSMQQAEDGEDYQDLIRYFSSVKSIILLGFATCDGDDTVMKSPKDLLQ